MNIGDTVKIISGLDKGKLGVIDDIWPDSCPYPYHLTINDRRFVPFSKDEIALAEKTDGY